MTISPLMASGRTKPCFCWRSTPRPRAARSNKHGSYQTDFEGLDVEVKDEARFADKWAYFNFDGTGNTASAMTPSMNDCWKCHDQNAAVEHSFVQFYPELLEIARAKGTIKPGVHLDN